MWGLLVNYGITATILRAATPAFGKLAAEEAKLEVGNAVLESNRHRRNGMVNCRATSAALTPV